MRYYLPICIVFLQMTCMKFKFKSNLNFCNIFTLLYFLFSINIFSQISNDSTSNENESKIKKIAKNELKQVKITGGINANSTLYFVESTGNSQPPRRDPFFGVVSGNITLKYRELSLPFSVSLSTQNANFTRPQPFNQFGVSPKYKFITLHLGYRSMNLSEFSLAGNLFLGAGFEFNHEKFPIKVSALVGRFAKAYTRNDQGLLKNYPSFERFGFGAKIMYEKNKSSIGLVLFRAADNPNSVSQADLEYLASKGQTIKPAENLVVGLVTKLPINKIVSISAEYTLSALNPDIKQREVLVNDYSYINNIGGLFTPRASSRFNSAFSGSIELSLKIVKLNGTYRRIGSDYQTLGSTFLNNDFEDITAGVSWAMFNNKVNMSTNGGIQRNNLSELQLSTLLRIIGSVSATYAASKKLNFNTNYSNFNSSTQLTPFVFNATNDLKPDSLLYLQLTHSAGVGGNYLIGSEKNKSNLFSNITFQNASDNKKVSTLFYNINTGYSTKLPEKKVDISTSINFSSNISQQNRLINIGPVLTISKPIINEKIKITFNTSYQTSINNGKINGGIFNNRLSATYNFKKKHNFTFDVVFLMRKQTQNNQDRSFREIRFGLNYGWSF